MPYFTIWVLHIITSDVVIPMLGTIRQTGFLLPVPWGPPRTHVTHTPATGVSRFHQASEAEGSGRLGLNTQFLLVYLFVFVVVVGFLFIYNGNVQDTEHVGFIKAPPIPMTMDIGYKVQNQCQDPGLHCPMTCCASF